MAGQYTINEETQIEIENGELTEREWDFLRESDVIGVKDSRPTGQVERIKLYVPKLARLGYEYKLLNELASPIEQEILTVFTNSEEKKLSTGEIAERIDRPNSSISRALTRLADEEKLEQIKPGLYRPNIKLPSSVP